MHIPSLIEKKRDGGELSSEEIAQVISGFTRGEIPDCQMSALAMAIFFRGMSDMETWYLTKAMLESGQIFDIHQTPRPRSTNIRLAQLAERLHSFWHRCWPVMTFGYQ